jgi:branched-subunit amino acid ABC-type transport system permease component
MTNVLTFLLLGLGNGAVFAAVGLSLTISYRASNVMNFGAGAMALFGAVTYQTASTQHAIFNPLATPPALTWAVLAAGFGTVATRSLRMRSLPGRSSLAVTLTTVVLAILTREPSLVNIGSNLGPVSSLLVAAALSAAFGVALYSGVFRHLRTALPLTRAVAAIGILLAVPSLVQHRFGGGPLSAPPILPGSVWHLGALVLQESQVFAAALIAVLASCLSLFYRKTRFGHQTTIAAETDIGATILGISPGMVGGVNWAIGGTVAGVFGALVASLTPVAPASFALFVVPGLAAAMLGGMSSFGWTVAAGLAIGMLESVVQYWQASYTFLPREGLTDLVPLVLLIVVMLARGRGLPERGALIRRALPSAPAPRHVRLWATALVAAGVLLALTLHGGYLVALSTTLVGFLFALSLVVLVGYVGQISLAQYMFAGVAAFMLARLTVDWHVPFPAAPLVAALIAAVAGALFSLPAVRVRGVNLAVLTLSAGVAVQNIYFSNTSYVGGNGSPTVKSPALFGLQLGIGTPGHYPRPEFALLLIVVALPAALLVVGLRRSTLGLDMLAVRANERAAAANGINVAAVKLMAFAVSAFLAGLSGSFLAYLNYGGFSSASFDSFLSLALVASVFASGITSMAGAVIAATVFAGGIWAVLLQRYVPFGDWYGVFAGLALVVSAIAVPDGVAAQLAHLGSVAPWRRVTDVCRGAWVSSRQPVVAGPSARGDGLVTAGRRSEDTASPSGVMSAGDGHE